MRSSRRQRFLLTSHARPDGDSIGSQLAMAFALEALGKQVRIVNSDAAPDHYQEFPGMERIEIARAPPTADVDAVIVMECSDLDAHRCGRARRPFIINIDHHAGNRMYGALNWHDESAAACGEMVFDLIRALGVPLTLEIATHIYLAILTDTGFVPSLEHHPADLRHLPADGGGGRRSRRRWPGAYSTATASEN